MKIELLELFILLAKHGSFSKVAEITYSTQSSVSKKIAKLETAVDFRLFNRDPKGVFLTKAGEVFYPYAKDILRLHDESLVQLAHLRINAQKQMTIGATTLYSQYVMPSLIHSWRENHPDLLLLLQQGRSQEMLNQLNHGNIDALIASAYLSYNYELFQAYPMQFDQLLLIVPNHHPFANRPYVRLAELADQPFIVKEESGRLYQHILETIKQIIPEFRFNQLIEINNLNNIIWSVGYGVGVSIVSELALKANHQAGVTVVPIEDLQLHREIVCLTPRQMTAHQRLFVRFITEMYQTNGLTPSNYSSNDQT